MRGGGRADWPDLSLAKSDSSSTLQRLGGTSSSGATECQVECVYGYESTVSSLCQLVLSLLLAMPAMAQRWSVSHGDDDESYRTPEKACRQGFHKTDWF